MFSIPVSDLTPEILKKAEWWAFIGMPNDKGVPMWKEVHQPQNLSRNRYGELYCMFGKEAPYSQDTRCFPVALSAEGDETRLECPRLPDEVSVDEHAGPPISPNPNAGQWVVTILSLSKWRKGPTDEHVTRKTLEGVWVWSTRK